MSTTLCNVSASFVRLDPERDTIHYFRGVRCSAWKSTDSGRRDPILEFLWIFVHCTCGKRIIAFHLLNWQRSDDILKVIDDFLSDPSIDKEQCWEIPRWSFQTRTRRVETAYSTAWSRQGSANSRWQEESPVMNVGLHSSISTTYSTRKTWTEFQRKRGLTLLSGGWSCFTKAREKNYMARLWLLRVRGTLS